MGDCGEISVEQGFPEQTEKTEWGFKMKVTKAAGIQCAILVLILAAEIVFASRHRAAYNMEETADSDLQEDAQGNMEGGLSEEDAVSGLPGGAGSSDSCLQDREEYGDYGLSDKDGNNVPGSEDEETEYVSELGVPTGIVEPAKIVWEEVPVEHTKLEFTFGDIQVIISEQKTQWEYQEREDGAVSVCLSSKEKLFEKLYLTHYRTEWDCKWELILAAKEYFGSDGDSIGWFSFKDSPDAERYFGVWGATEEGKSFHMLVFDEELYLLEENTARSFSFTELSNGRKIRSDVIGGRIVAEFSKNKIYIRNFGEKEAVYLLREGKQEDGQEKIAVYQDGNFERPAQVLQGNLDICKDINFDGCPDLKKRDRDEEKKNDYLIWNRADRKFVEAVMPSDESFKIDKAIFCDDFETIWCGSDENYEEQSAVERLYRWNGAVLEEIRSISSQRGAGTVSVILTDKRSGECIASETFPEKDWQNNPGIRKLYDQFYQGYAPKELYHVRHGVPGEEEYIPESLVEALTRAFEENREMEFLWSCETGRELTEAEAEEVRAENPDITGTGGDWEEYWAEENRLILADLDDDGYEDIYALICDGGTAGFTDFAVFQGNAEGEYEETERFSAFRWPFVVISWEGKNYVCRTIVDYGKKERSALVLYAYRNGRPAETVALNLVPEKQVIAVTSCEEGYWEIAERQIWKAPEIYQKTETAESSTGDAEQKTEYGLGSDFDNDGAVEDYYKHMWTPSNMWIDSGLIFGTKTEAEGTVLQEMISENEERLGTPIMMWVDGYRGENIVNVMYRTWLYDYVIEGYLMDDAGHYSRLYCVEAKTERTVETTRAWQYSGGSAG